MAIKQALLSTGRFRVGCAIAKGKRILYAGYNQMDRTHPKMGHVKRLHAEVHALLPTHGEPVVGAKAYVVRIMSNGGLGLARPCPDCIKALRQHGIEEVCYTDTNGVWVEEGI